MHPSALALSVPARLAGDGVGCGAVRCDGVTQELTQRTGRNPQARSPARRILQRHHTALSTCTLLYCDILTHPHRSDTHQYSYLSVGCSKVAEERMLNYARTLVGRPFSNTGMIRSIIYPRQSNEKSFFCAGAFSRLQQTS